MLCVRVCVCGIRVPLVFLGQKKFLGKTFFHCMASLWTHFLTCLYSQMLVEIITVLTTFRNINNSRVSRKKQQILEYNT